MTVEMSGCLPVCDVAIDNTGLSSSPPVVVDYKWVRDDVVKYKPSLTSVASVAALQC